MTIFSIRCAAGLLAMAGTLVLTAAAAPTPVPGDAPPAAPSKEEVTPDLVLKRFVAGMLLKDETLVRANSLDHEELSLLWRGEKPPEEQSGRLLAELQGLPVEWLAPGDKLRLNGRDFTVNAGMVNADRQIGSVRLMDYAFPVTVVRVGGQWRVQPLMVLAMKARELKEEMKKLRKDYTVMIDGQSVELDLEKDTEFEIGGVKHKLRLVRNLFQNLEDENLKLRYLRDFEPRRSRNEDCLVWTFAGHQSVLLLVECYGPELEPALRQRQITDAFVENYKKLQAQIGETPLQPVEMDVGPRRLKGVELVSVLNDVEHIDRFVFWAEGGRVMGLHLSFDRKDTATAQDLWAAIADSLSVKPLAPAPATPAELKP